jgi:radical SAM protein with 4Fe4S-binding SPASM domain
MKHVEFFSKLKGKVGIGISHDGPAHETLRGPEFLHKKIEVLKALQKLPNVQFSFNPVVSRTNHDVFAINKFFYDFCKANGLDINKTGISWTVGRNHDYENTDNSAGHVIGGESLASFKAIMKRYMDANIEQWLRNKDHQLLRGSFFTGQLGVLPYVQTLKEQILPTVTTACGVDDASVLSVDISGNVRTCPHTDESFIGGHIEDLKNVRLKKIDLGRYERHCHKCPVYRLCKSNCPIEVPDEVFYQNCAIEKVWHRSIQDTAFKILFNSEVTLIEDKSGTN